MARTVARKKKKTNKTKDDFDVKAWISACPTTSKCQTCSHPIAEGLLREALQHMADASQHHVTRTQLHSMLTRVCKERGKPYTTKATAFQNHLKRCVSDLWDLAKGRGHA